MTTETLTNLSGSIEDASRFADYGFIVADDGGRNVFLHRKNLTGAGFSVNDLRDNAKIVFDAELDKMGRRRVARLHSVGDKLAKPAGKPRQKRSQNAESQPLTLGQFVNVKPVDRNKETGERLLKVCTRDGEFVQYLTADGDGNVLRQLGPVTLAEAREQLGRVIVHPMPEGHGQPTNVPTVSQAMKGRTGGGQAQKKAA